MTSTLSKSRLKTLRSLRRKKVREAEGLLLVEGLNGLEGAAAHGSLREVLVGEERLDHPRVRAVVEASGAPLTALTGPQVEALTQTRAPAGAFGLAADPCRDLDEDRAAAWSLVLLAAGVADPGNLGTLIRTCAALGVEAVIVTGGGVEPTNPKVVRATAGALYRVPVVRAEAEALSRAGLTIRAADAAGTPLDRLRVRPRRLALAVGSEPHGVPDDVRAISDGAIAIPLRNDVESLNVTVAAGILLHGLRALPPETDG